MNKLRGQFVLWYLLMVLVVLSIPFFAHAGETGNITGLLVDSEYGEPLIGANVYIENTSLGAASDLDGRYVILGVPAGKHTLVVSMIGYAETKINQVEVIAGEVTTIDVTVSPEILTTDVVVVEARALQNTDASLLKQRQRSNAVSDAISAEAISRAGSGDAAEAMKMVTGASVVGGKYVYVRGLGERYSNTHLNGAELPTADPDKKSFQMDLLPTNLLDNIVTVKSFTPDKPGNFSGGIVDIATRAFPDKFTLKFSSSAGYNSVTSFNSNYLSGPVGSSDWLGMDGGDRGIPSDVKDLGQLIPSEAESRYNEEKALLLDRVSDAFAPQMTPTTATAPMNHGYSFSVGNQVNLFGNPLGFLGSLTYSNSTSFYENGTVGRWKLSGHVSETDSLNKQLYLRDSKGTREASWGALGTLAYKPHPEHEIGINYLRTQSGTSTARYEVGEWPEQLSGANSFFETRVLQYTERSLNSAQVSGEHHFSQLGDALLEWKGSYGESLQNEPDLRYFSDNYSQREYMGRDTLIYSLSPSLYDKPSRYYRNMYERSRSADVKISLPFKQWAGLASRARVGWAYGEKWRVFGERRFQYEQATGTRYTGDPEAFFSADNIGILSYDSTYNKYIFGNYIQESPDPRGGNYSGTQRILAGFGMIELPLTTNLQAVFGVRYEATRMAVGNVDTSGYLNNNDWLPSLNFVYRLGENMNVRAAYGRTLARPNFREKAPYANFSFVNDFIYNGNVNLERTLINNYDLRWEWFLSPGEILAVSGYYKHFKNPIERVINVLSDNPFVQYANVDEAKVYGVEIEARHGLGSMADWMKYFSLGANVTIAASEIRIPDEEMVLIRELNPGASDTRPLQGQSPYLINVDLSYDNYESGTSAGIYFNTFGKRLAEVSAGGTPNVYEEPRPTLDLTVSQKLMDHFRIKFSARNLLDSDYRLTQSYKEVDYIRQQYETGRSFGISASYEID
jgi:outer membrane receptor protein involved in Fe transport